MLNKKPAAPATAPKQTNVPSLISADVTITGDFASTGEVQFDGQITGDLRADGLVIGEGATVRGEVSAQRVRVCGKVTGVIRAMRVDLAATAVIEGDVMHAALTVEDGARLDGKVCCRENPLAKPGALDTKKVAAELAEQPALRPAPDQKAARAA